MSIFGLSLMILREEVLVPYQATITAKSSWNTNTFLRFSESFPFFVSAMGVQAPSPVVQCGVASRNPYLCKNALLLPAGLFISPSHSIVLRGRGFCSLPIT